MTNNQLTAVLVTVVGLVILVLAYPSIERSIRMRSVDHVECHTIGPTLTQQDYDQYIADNGVAPYVQTRCE